jgi:hypothetical protein
MPVWIQRPLSRRVPRLLRGGSTRSQLGRGVLARTTVKDPFGYTWIIGDSKKWGEKELPENIIFRARICVYEIEYLK